MRTFFLIQDLGLALQVHEPRCGVDYPCPVRATMTTASTSEENVFNEPTTHVENCARTQAAQKIGQQRRLVGEVWAGCRQRVRGRGNFPRRKRSAHSSSAAAVPPRPARKGEAS